MIFTEETSKRYSSGSLKMFLECQSRLQEAMLSDMPVSKSKYWPNCIKKEHRPHHGVKNKLLEDVGEEQSLHCLRAKLNLMWDVLLLDNE